MDWIKREGPWRTHAFQQNFTYLRFRKTSHCQRLQNIFIGERGHLGFLVYSKINSLFHLMNGFHNQNPMKQCTKCALNELVNWESCIDQPALDQQWMPTTVLRVDAIRMLYKIWLMWRCKPGVNPVRNATKVGTWAHTSLAYKLQRNSYCYWNGW